MLGLEVSILWLIGDEEVLLAFAFLRGHLYFFRPYLSVGHIRYMLHVLPFLYTHDKEVKSHKEGRQ